MANIPKCLCLDMISVHKYKSTRSSMQRHKLARCASAVLHPVTDQVAPPSCYPQKDRQLGILGSPIPPSPQYPSRSSSAPAASPHRDISQSCDLQTPSLSLSLGATRGHSRRGGWHCPKEMRHLAALPMRQRSSCTQWFRAAVPRIQASADEGG